MYRFFYFLCVFYVPLFAQTNELFSLSGKFSIAGTDINGNFYLIRKNTLTRYDNTGKSIYNYTDNSLGTISHVSISNPLKISVLFASAGMLVILDNTLSPIGAPIALHRIGIDDPVAACPADENGCWVYDAASGFFSLIGWNGQILQRSVDVRRNFTGTFFPTDMVMFSGNILAFSSSAGAIAIDNAGNIIGIYNTNGKVRAIGPQGICFFENNKIAILNPLNMSESFVPLEIEGMKNFSLNFPYLLVQFEKKISLYLLTSQ